MPAKTLRVLHKRRGHRALPPLNSRTHACVHPAFSFKQYVSVPSSVLSSVLSGVLSLALKSRTHTCVQQPLRFPSFNHTQSATLYHLTQHAHTVMKEVNCSQEVPPLCVLSYSPVLSSVLCASPVSSEKCIPVLFCLHKHFAMR